MTRNSNEEKPISRFQYSLGVGFAILVSTIGITSFVSKRYLSYYDKIGLFLFLFTIFVGFSGLILNVLIEGFALTDLVSRDKTRMKSLSKNCFNYGMIFVFLSLLTYAPFYILLRLTSSVWQSPAIPPILFITIFLIFSLITLNRFGKLSLKKRERLSFGSRKDILAHCKELHHRIEVNHVVDSLILISGFGISLLIIMMVCSHSYEITMQQEYYYDRGEMCRLIITPTGFASIDNPNQLKVWRCSSSQRPVKLPLYQSAEDIYYTSFAVSDFKETEVYYVEFEMSAFPWGPIRERKVLILERDHKYCLDACL